MDVEPALDDRRQHVVGGVEVVADRVALVAAALHRVRRGALLGEVHERVGLPVLEQVEQALVVDRHVDVVERDVLAGHLLPGPQPLAHRPDRRQRRDLELDVDLATGQVVDDRHLVPLRGQVQRRGPAAEAVPAKNEYPHSFPSWSVPAAASASRAASPESSVSVADDGSLPSVRVGRSACVARPAGRGVEVQAALLHGVHLPPPAAGPRVLAGGDGAGAGGAADAGVTAVVEPVVGHRVVVDVGPHLLGRPLQHRVELLEAVVLVPRRHLEVAPGRRLLAPQARSARPAARQGLAQRLRSCGRRSSRGGSRRRRRSRSGRAQRSRRPPRRRRG